MLLISFLVNILFLHYFILFLISIGFLNTVAVSDNFKRDTGSQLNVSLQITNPPGTNISYNLASNHTIRCEAEIINSTQTHTTIITYRWSYVEVNGTVTKVSDHAVLDKQVIIRYGEGIYICIASLEPNYVKNQSFRISLRPGDKSSILYFTNLTLNSTQVQLIWKTNIINSHLTQTMCYLKQCSVYLPYIKSSNNTCTHYTNISTDGATTFNTNNNLIKEYRLTIADLIPYHKYHVKLMCEVESQELNFTTVPDAPPFTPQDLKVFWSNSTVLNVRWSLLHPNYSSNSTISYTIIIFKTDDKFVQQINISSEDHLINNSIKVVYGLNWFEKYKLKFCALNKFGHTCTDLHIKARKIPFIGNLTQIIVVILAIFLFISLIMVSCLSALMYRKKLKRNGSTTSANQEFILMPTRDEKLRQSSNSQHPMLPEQEPDSGISDQKSQLSDDSGQPLSPTEQRVKTTLIQINAIDEYIREHTQNGCALAIDEFSDLPKGLLRQITIGLQPGNSKKNRYPNICPYDHNRLLLESSQYINASNLSCDWLTYSYIAAQGPLNSSISVFWQMIWENKISTILMLTGIREATYTLNRSSCVEYWPEIGKTAHFGNIDVRHETTTNFAHYVIRTFYISSPAQGSEKMKVTQLQFTSWPNSGIPPQPFIMWQFLSRVKRLHHPTPSDQSSILLHCADGSQRSGLILVMLELMEKLQQDQGEINLFEMISKLRAERINIIPNVEQYIYLHKALLAQANCGDTSVQIRNFAIACRYLDQEVAENGPKGFQEQFDLLAKACPYPAPEELSEGRRPLNINKNRYHNKIPNNQFRFVLDVPLTEESSDYINASYIDSCLKRQAFIAAQGPLEQTVPQFWSMVVTSKASVIVMLTNLYENGNEMCAHYWPTSTEMLTIKDISISFVDEKEEGRFKIREFLVAHGAQRQPVYQVHLQNWSTEGPTPSNDDILSLIKEVYRINKATGSNNPIIVHCDDGMDRTGAFISIYNCLEHALYGGVVDVFQVVKSMRAQRPMMVKSLKQYIICYTSVLHAINSSFCFQ